MVQTFLPTKKILGLIHYFLVVYFEIRLF